MSERQTAQPNKAATWLPVARQAGKLQHKCACGNHTVAGSECAECCKKRLQRKATGREQETAVPPIVNDVLRSPGQPLDPDTRAFMEPRFGHDFSRVRVHTDEKAGESAQMVNALAYTVGEDVVFAPGQYTPTTTAGQRLLAHELTHVIQQAAYAAHPTELALGSTDDACEIEAQQTADFVTASAQSPLPSTGRPPIQSRPSGLAAKTVQRFSTAEHQEIGNRAYAQANPGAQSGGVVEPPLSLSELFSARSLATNQEATTITAQSYGQIVAIADDVTSLLFLEERERERAGTRIPILSPIWDWIGDATHYIDLAARNRQHFHPHNWRSWQRWHWTAVRHMNRAYQVGQEAVQMKSEINTLLRQFDAHYQRGRAALEQADTLGGHETTAARRETLEQVANRELQQMNLILAQLRPKANQYLAKKAQAKELALRAVAVNGFGDHFLTDAFAAGHIVTPREELLGEYQTRLFGLFLVGGVLHCANIPSLAWHDLDNRFGVWVNDLAGNSWLTFGDNYANREQDESSAPLGQSRSPTLTRVVEATAESMRQIWAAAAGNPPADLSAVLNRIPRPDLSPGKYPNWKPDPAVAWDRQLRYAAGEAVGANYDILTSSTPSNRPTASNRPTEEVPNPQGEQIGQGPLSARATCWNVRSAFGYDRFVIPMLERLRRGYAQRYYSGRPEQLEPPTAAPTTQESVKGSVVAGSIIGGLGGALAGVGLGLLAGGPIGALIGGLVGLIGGFLAGGFIGGLLGEERAETPAV